MSTKGFRGLSGRLFSLYQNVIGGIFWVILLLLSFYSAVSTCYLSADRQEFTYFVQDNPLVNLLSAIAVVGLFFVLRSLPVCKKIADTVEQNTRLFLWMRRFLLLALWATAVLWIFLTQSKPEVDQAAILNFAQAIHYGDFSQMARGGYLDHYPFQLGLIWFNYIFITVARHRMYLLFQLMNTLGLVMFYRDLSLLTDMFGFRRIHQLLVVAVGILFFPLTFYCTFVYGNILGLAFSLAAIRQELLFLRSEKVHHAALSALAIFFALLFKTNYVIFLVGMLIHFLLWFIKAPRVRLLLLPALLLAAYLAQSTIPVMLARQVSGQPLDQGSSMWAHAAMGLQDGSRAPGWYNEYNWESYEASGCRTDIQAAMAQKSIRGSLAHYLAAPDDAIRFFSQKTTSQWCNPTFQSFWIAQVQPSRAEKILPVRQLLSVRGMDAASAFLNLFQFNILIGSLLYCVLCRKKQYFAESLILPLIFIGGFVFHIFWEAKAQYTISYFVLLLPYCILGFSGAVEFIKEFASRKSADLSLTWLGFLAVLTAAAACALIFLYSGSRYECLVRDTSAYSLYLEESEPLHVSVILD